MKTLSSLLLIGLTAFASHSSHAGSVAATINGIDYPTELKNWRVIGNSYRMDNNTQRVILGNDIAIKAARSGKTNPWPEKTILAKLVWKNTAHPQWNTAIVPKEFIHSEIMVKDSIAYKSTGGWGFARWTGTTQKPHGKTKSFAKNCFSCHGSAKNTDFVFTIPATIP